MPDPSASMLTHLAGSPLYIYDVWKLTARDGTIAAYANCSRSITFGGLLYKASPAESTRGSRVLGLEADGAELQGAFDEQIAKSDLFTHKWDDARITKDWVYFFNPDGYGSALTQKGFVGKITPGNGIFVIEFRSLSSRLDQTIGKLTSPIDRRRRADETGVNMAPYTHNTSVDSIQTQRRIFKVPYVQPTDNYFRYGIATFTSGNNNGKQLEIKSSTTTDGGTRTQIELQHSTPANLTVADTMTLVIGYDGTLAAAKALGSEAVISLDGEPTMPLADDILRYEP
jgi:uncharacterized phage protein (TIGR02218 family)